MTCIEEILKILDKKNSPLMVPMGAGKLVIEDGGIYKDHEFLITFTYMGHRCGYVVIPPENKLYNKELMYDENYSGIQVHGGITYCEIGYSIIKKVLGTDSLSEHWIGFDSGHAGDVPDLESYNKYFGEENEILAEHLKAMYKIYDGCDDCSIKTKDFMVIECIKLIDQIIELNK
jgi:hypothetical protein